jgi:hypothetical protein
MSQFRLFRTTRRDGSTWTIQVAHKCRLAPELALVLVRLDHFASRIVNANDGII